MKTWRSAASVSKDLLKGTALGAVCLLLVAQAITPSRLAAQQQPSTQYYEFDPAAVNVEQTDATVLLQARVLGNPSRVLLELSLRQPAVDVEARDDGTAGDRVAGDGIYSVRVDSSLIAQSLTHDDVFSVFVGYLKPLTATGAVAQRVNTFAPVVTSEIKRYPIARHASDVQSNPYVVNVYDPGYFVNLDPKRVTERFYRFVPDDFDFINIVQTPGYVENRHHITVHNDVRGIGLSLSNNTRQYGSGGRLLGLNVFPNTTFFDGANAGYLHELGHQWINYLTAFPFAGGIPHWPLSTLASGIMGYGAGSQGLAYPCELIPEATGIRLVPRRDQPVFKDLDLYLMGILAPEDVGEQIVFADQAAAVQLPCNNRVVNVPVVRAGIREIVDKAGARNPDWRAAPKQFKVATVVVSKDGLISADAMARYAWFARRAAERREVLVHEGFLKATQKAFFLATRGRALLDPTIAKGAADFDVATIPQAVTLGPDQSAAYEISITPEFARFDGEVTLSCAQLPENASCTFAPEAVVPGETGAQATVVISRDTPWSRGTYPVRIVGTSGTLTRYVTITVTVQ